MPLTQLQAASGCQGGQGQQSAGSVKVIGQVLQTHQCLGRGCRAQRLLIPQGAPHRDLPRGGPAKGKHPCLRRCHCHGHLEHRGITASCPLPWKCACLAAAKDPGTGKDSTNSDGEIPPRRSWPTEGLLNRLLPSLHLPRRMQAP